MSTGIQSSASVRPATAPATPPAAAPTGDVLRSGERTATTAEALSNPNAKTYYNMVSGSQFVMPDGLAIVFLGGRYVTDDPAQIAELDKVCNRPSSMIYTKADAKEADAALAKVAAADTVGSDGQTGKIEAAVVTK